MEQPTKFELGINMETAKVLGVIKLGVWNAREILGQLSPETASGIAYKNALRLIGR